MGAVSKSGLGSHENGAQIGIRDFGELHTLVRYQHYILRSGRMP
jgi:hypothetical protein